MAAAQSTRIAIVYYSTYGHVRTLAHSVRKGIEAAGGIATVYQVPETLPAEVLTAMHAPPKSDDEVLTHDKLSALLDHDGILFGIPTRFGMMAAQMKTFFDGTGQMWAKGQLVGKLAGVFCSTASQNGGQETTALTTITQFAHHGMIYVPIGYTFGTDMSSLKEAHGGSPYGAGTLAAGDGSRQPSNYELALAEHQGKYFTGVALKFKGPALSQ